MKLWNSFTNRDTIVWMLKEDDFIRLSEEIQNEFSNLIDPNDHLAIIERIQKSVVKRAKLVFSIENEDEDFGLHALRSAAHNFSDDDKVRSSCHYLKYNRVLNRFDKILSVGLEMNQGDFDVEFLKESFDFNTHKRYLLVTGSVS